MRRRFPSPPANRVHRRLRQYRMSTFNVDALDAPIRLYKSLHFYNSLQRHTVSKSGIRGCRTIDQPSFRGILTLRSNGNNAQNSSEK